MSSAIKGYSMQLDQLLSVINVEAPKGILVQDLAIDSRLVQQGSLFMAYPGECVDGRSYIAAAVDSGAVAILYEASNYGLAGDEISGLSIPVFAVNGLRNTVGAIANEFFQQPSSDLQVFGVTGTNGKTTCCYLLTQALSKLDMQAAMIGTIGNGQLNNLATASHTTPDAVAVHRLLAQWRDQGITQVCMEVSSHALDQCRVGGVNFFCTLFTNLTQDHLDYHDDMSSYRHAKERLFTDYASELVVTNADDAMGSSLIDIANSDFIASYGRQDGDVRLEEIKLRESGMELFIEANQIDFEVSTSLVGDVNVPNILLLVTTLLSLSVDIGDIQRIVSQLQAAPGRMELYSASDEPSVVVDYAHTPDALEKALLSIKQHCDGEVWCVFGCGGDRDQSKRPLMGEVVARLADHVVITNDNPRTEPAESIVRHIDEGINNRKTRTVTLDRAAAISETINKAKTNDWVLIAGKGHETTQQIGKEKLPFSDRQKVTQCLGVAA